MNALRLNDIATDPILAKHNPRRPRFLLNRFPPDKDAGRSRRRVAIGPSGGAMAKNGSIAKVRN
jgi:hypothetical protein